jgi:peroxiredoxin Q/BCP
MAQVKVGIGDRVPDIELEAFPSGRRVKLSAYAGKWVVLYFYPRDDTSGCTREACGFRDSMKPINEMGAEIVGVSTDSMKSHGKFAGKYDLSFTLLSDPKGSLGSFFGVLKEGGSSMLRVTFLIDPEGRISKIYPKVDPSLHAAQVLADLRELVAR